MPISTEEEGFVPYEIQYVENLEQKKGDKTRAVVINVKDTAEELKNIPSSNIETSSYSNALASTLQNYIKEDIKSGKEDALDKFLNNLDPKGQLTDIEKKTIKQALEEDFNLLKKEMSKGFQFNPISAVTKQQNISAFKEKIAVLIEHISTSEQQEFYSSQLRFVSGIKKKLSDTKNTQSIRNQLENRSNQTPVGNYNTNNIGAKNKQGHSI